MSNPHQKFKKVVVLDSENLTTLMEIPIEEMKRVFCVITNTVTSLDQFEIQARSNDGQDYVTLRNSAGEFTSPRGVLIDSSGDLTALGAATGWFICDVESFQSLRIQAARASGSNATVTLQAGGL